MTTIITYPSGVGFPGFVSYTLDLARKSVVMRSPFTGKRQVNNSVYALWEFTGKYAQCVADNARLLRSFLMQLQGQANSFRLAPPEYTSPSTGYAGAAGLVNGASQTGVSLITDGWTASAAIFKAGDFFTVNDEFKMLTADATANGSGQVTLSFLPALRKSPADNLALIIVNPTILMTSTDDSSASWDVTPPFERQFQLNAIECVE